MTVLRRRFGGWSLTALIRLLIGIARLTVRLPRRRLAWLFSAAKAGAARVDALRPAESALAELADIVANDEQGLTAVRGILCQSRTEELTALVRGAVRHHVRGKSPVSLQAPPLPALGKRSARGAVIIAGEPASAAALVNCYEKIYNCSVLRHVAARGPLTAAALPRNLLLVEFTSSAPGVEQSAAELLTKGIAVGIAYRCLQDPGMVQRLAAIARVSAAPLRIAYLPAYYPPVTAARTYVADGGMGELVSLRVQAIAGGGGGQLVPQRAPQQNIFRYEAFDYLPLLVLFGGVIRNASVYGHGMDQARGGQAIAAFEFARAPLVAGLECVSAPELIIRSSQYPFAAEAEAAGTDGVPWFDAGMGARIHQPAVRVRAGRQCLCLGEAQGLRTDWDAALQCAAGTLIGMAAGRGQPVLSTAAAAHALEVTGWLARTTG